MAEIERDEKGSTKTLPKPEGDLEAQEPSSRRGSNPAIVWDSSPATEVGSMGDAEGAQSAGGQGNEKSDKEADSDLVTWNGDNDPENPHNWPVRKRVGVTAIWIIGNIVTTIASSIFASGASLIEEEFDISPTVATLGVSLFLVVSSISYSHSSPQLL